MIQTLLFLANFNNLRKFQKFQNTDESPKRYMNREEIPACAGMTCKVRQHDDDVIDAKFLLFAA